MISLAGGLPAASGLPTERLRQGTAHVFDHHGQQALQYGPTVGEPVLRELLASLEATHPDEVVITAGSQQALDLLARTLCVPGDSVVVEAPGYVGALQVLRAAQVDIIGCPVDTDGLDTSVLEQILGRGVRPRAVYVNPNHQNPTGASLTAERRRHLLDLADRHGFWVIADDPYREITFDRTVPSPDHGLHPSTHGRVILLGSLSKTLSPGLRIGWCSGPPRVMERVEEAKQAADLHTATLNQLLAAFVLSDHRWWTMHLQALRADYRERRNRLTAAVGRHLPGASISPQTGGFFTWLGLPGIDTTALIDRALDVGVAFVPGSAFTVEQRPTSMIRLSYSSADPDTFDEGLRRLAAVIAGAQG
jgi:2-aminoadipate transaminase